MCVRAYGLRLRLCTSPRAESAGGAPAFAASTPVAGLRFHSRAAELVKIHATTARTMCAVRCALDAPPT
eukprot:3188398-Alexandrium_andersonii.AAC.1